MKKILFVFLLMFISASLFSQSMTKRWLAEFSAGNTWDDFGKDLVQDASGNVYVASQIDNGSNLDIVLIKYNSIGELQWSQTFDNGADDMAIRVHLDAAENIYVTGNTVMGSVNQVLILKYFPSGNLRWHKNTSSVAGATATASDIINTNVVITGYSYSSATDANVLTMKYDSAGTLTWAQSYDQSGTVSTDIEKGLDIAIRATTGDIYISGTATVLGSADFLVLKYNSSGVQQFATTRDYSVSADNATSISIGGVGTAFAVYVTGRCYNTTIGESMVTMKFSSTGAYQWASEYSGNNDIEIADNCFYGGNVYSIGYDNAGAVPLDLGAHLVKYNSSGVEQWSIKTTNSYYAMYGTNGIAVSDGYMYVADYAEIKKVDMATGAFLDSVAFIGGTIYALLPGTNGVLATGIKSDHSEVITFEVCTPVSILTAGNDTIFCQYDTIQLHGSGADTYLWSTVSSVVNIIDFTSATAKITSSTSGYDNIKVEGIDVNGCPLVPDTVNIQILIAPRVYGTEIEYFTPIEFCLGGYVNLYVNGDFPSCTFDWYKDGVFTGISDTVLTVTQEGNYYVEIFSAIAGCTKYSETETVSFISLQDDVYLGNDTSICANIPFAIEPDITGLYQWNTGETTKAIAVSNAGTYIVTVTVPGCAGSVDSLTITSLIENETVDLGPDTSVCSNHPYTLVGEGNHTAYHWSNSSTASYLDVNSSGLYWLEVTNSTGCKYRDSVLVNYRGGGYVQVLPDTVICSSSSVNLRPEYVLHKTDSFNFGEDITSHFYSKSGTVSTPTSTSTMCGNDKGVNVGYTAGSTGWVEITAAVDPGTNIVMIEYLVKTANSGTIDISIDGISFGSKPIAASCVSDTLFFTGLSGLTADGEVVIRFADNIAGSDLSGRFILNNISIYSDFTPTGGFEWTSAGGFYSTSLTNSVVPSATEYYVFTYQDGSCTGYDTATVLVGSVDLGVDIEACVGDSIEIDAGAGFLSYLWSNGETSRTIIATSSNDYSVIAVSAVCGTVYDTVHVDFHSIAAPDLGNDTTICIGNTLLLDAGTANGYNWNTGATSSSISVSNSGEYTVIVSDMYGCENTDTLQLTVSSLPIVNLGNDTSVCDYLYIEAGIHDSYLWSDNSTSDFIEITSSGNYSVTVANVVGCESVDTISVVIVASPIVDITSGFSVYKDLGVPDIIACEGDTVELNAQNAGCTYMWSTGSSSQIEYVTSNGTYRVTVTEATGMCSEIGDVEIAFNDKPEAGATLTEASCGLSDGSAAIHVSGGNSPFLYNWSNSATVDSLGNLSAGVYSVIVEDTYGCLDTISFTITNPNAPIVTPYVESVSCFGECDGLAEALLTGGTAPFSYVWSNGDTTSISDSLCSSTYYVTVTDANSCESMETFVVAEPDILQIALSSIPETYPGASDGKAWVLVSGGTGPYNYEWNNSSVNDTISGIAGGWYYVTVTDANGCSATDSIEVTITVGLSQLESKIHIYPNPSFGNYVLLDGVDTQLIKRIELISIDSRNVVLQIIDHKIDLHGVDDGVYILRIFSDDELIHQEKLVIVK
jgi:hypothetical protein